MANSESVSGKNAAVEVKFDGSLPSSSFRVEVPENFKISDVIKAAEKASAEINSMLTQCVTASTTSADRNSPRMSDEYNDSDDEDSLKAGKNEGGKNSDNHCDEKRPKLDSN